MTWVVSATLLVTVTVTVTFSLAFREPPAGATLTLAGISATWMRLTVVRPGRKLGQKTQPDIRTTRPRGYGKIRSLTWAGGWNGIQTCTLVPTPTADLSIAWPPCAAAIACTMDSPRPLP